MGINLAQLRYLVALIDTGTTQRAAEQVHVSQPSISRAIGSLESELGVTLFVRDGRRLVPTEAAAEVVAVARRIMADVDHLADLGGRRETVRTAATPSMEALVADAFIRSARQLPRGTRVEFVAGASSAEVEQLVKSGSADVGLIEHPPNLRLRSRRLCDIELLIVARPEMGLTNPIPVAELNNVGLVLPRQGSKRRLEIDAYLAELGVTPKVAFESDNRAAWLSAASSGHAASLTFAIGERPASDGVQYYSIDPPITLGLYVIYVRQPSVAVEAMFDSVAAANPSSSAESSDP